MGLKQFLLGKDYIGIEQFSVGAEDRFAVLEVKNKKEGLVITSTQILEDFNQFGDRQKQLPAFLVLNTSQILQKEINTTEGSDEKLIHKAFPNISVEEFYFEVWRKKDKSCIAIARKSYIDDVLTRYGDFSIAGFSLGVTVLSELQNFTSVETFATSHQYVSLGTDPIVVEKEEPTSYEINGLDIESTYLHAFSGILRLLLQNGRISGNNSTSNLTLSDNCLQQQFFSKGLKIGVAFLLAVLLINFAAFNYFHRKALSVSERIAVNESQASVAADLQNRIALKTKKLAQLQGLDNLYKAPIINEITKRLPASILLKEFTLNPLQKRIKPEEPLLVVQNTILISGTTIDSKAFTNWVEMIGKCPFSKELIITYFGNEDNATTFSIKLILKEDEAQQQK